VVSGRNIARAASRDIRVTSGPPFPPEQVDQRWGYEWASEDCHGWKPLEEFRVVQQVELTDKPFWVSEHRARRYRCPTTGKIITAPLPGDVVRSGLVGPRLSALLAHLIRDIAFLTTLPDPVTKRWGEKLLREAKQLFRTWHCREKLTKPEAERQLRRRHDAFLTLANRPPPRSETRKLTDRMRMHRREYFTFLDLPDFEPTNNGTERAHRFVVIDRKVTQGTRGVAGRRWCERIWTTVATCTQQHRSALRFLHDAVLAYVLRTPAPSLLPQIP